MIRTKKFNKIDLIALVIVIIIPVSYIVRYVVDDMYRNSSKKLHEEKVTIERILLNRYPGIPCKIKNIYYDQECAYFANVVAETKKETAFTSYISLSDESYHDDFLEQIIINENNYFDDKDARFEPIAKDKDTKGEDIDLSQLEFSWSDEFVLNKGIVYKKLFLQKALQVYRILKKYDIHFNVINIECRAVEKYDSIEDVCYCTSYSIILDLKSANTPNDILLESIKEIHTQNRY